MHVMCDYCSRPTEYVTGATVYPHRPDLAGRRFYRCVPCNAYVGVHEGTDQPLGRLANPQLRRAKVAAHSAFDPLWKPTIATKPVMRRGAAYEWLARELGIRAADCHIGMFDVATCLRVVEICRRRRALDLTNP